MKTTKFTPNYAFNNNMVLQCGRPVKIYGVGGNKNLIVTVNFNNQVKSAYPNADGTWVVTLSPMQAIAIGQTLTITHGDDKFQFNNVVVGEVWYCSGQSNIAMTFNELLEKRNIVSPVDYSSTPFSDYKNYINYDKIRIYHQAFNSVEFTDSIGLVRDKMRNGWFTPTCVEDLGDYTPYAVGFALRLQEVLGVPVGIIVCSVGGSSIEEWLSIDTIKKYNLKLHYTEQTKPHSRLYNGMAFPLNNFTIAGVLWYQGCADSGNKNANDWHADMIALCDQFRKAHGFVPILSQSLVQYNENADWSIIRQANYDLMSEVDNFYTINGIDAGMPYEKEVPSGFTNWIHPSDKYGISKNGAEIALTCVYGLSGYNGVAAYPINAKAEGNDLVIYYHNDVKLKLSIGKTVNNLQGFNGLIWEVIDNAKIDQNKIIILDGSKYTKVCYANYNVMMPGATKIANAQYNSELLINLFSEKPYCTDLAVFPFKELEVKF